MHRRITSEESPPSIAADGYLMATNDETARAPSHSRVQAHFDDNVSLYVDKHELAHYRAACIERIGRVKQLMGHESDAILRMLDIGCGGGQFLDLFLNAFPNATAFGVDLSDGMLRENAPSNRKRLLQGDALHIPADIGQFDVVNVDTLMHHLICGSYSETLAQIRRFLQGLHRFLKPGGIVMVREIYHEYRAIETLGSRIVFELSTLQLPQFTERALKWIGIQSANAGVCFLTRRQWRAVFDEAGFTVRAFQDKPWQPPPHRRYGFKASGDLFYILGISC